MRSSYCLLLVLAALLVGANSVSEAQEAEPKTAQDFFQRGDLLRSKNDYDLAIAAYTEAIRLNPKFVSAYVCRALCREQRHDLDDALKDFDLAIDLDPKDPWIRLSRGRTRIANGDIAGGIADDTAVIVRGPSVQDRFVLKTAYLDRGLARRVAGDLEDSEADVTQAIRLVPEEGGCYVSRGEIREDRGDFAGAVEDYSSAIRLDGPSASLHLKRAMACDERGDVNGAIADYDEVIRRSPEFTAALIRRGIAKGVKGDKDGAIRDLDEAVRLQPSSSCAYASRAGLEFDWGQYEQAVKDVLEVLDLHDPTESDYAALLGMVCKLHLGEKDPATIEFRAPFKGRSGRASGDWPATIAAFLQGKIREEDLLEAATTDSKAQKEHTCEAWFYAGVVRLARGDSEIAKSYFQKCINVGLPSMWEHKHAVAELELMLQK